MVEDEGLFHIFDIFTTQQKIGKFLYILGLIVTRDCIEKCLCLKKIHLHPKMNIVVGHRHALCFVLLAGSVESEVLDKSVCHVKYINVVEWPTPTPVEELSHALVEVSNDGRFLVIEPADDALMGTHPPEAAGAQPAPGLHFWGLRIRPKTRTKMCLI